MPHPEMVVLAVPVGSPDRSAGNLFTFYVYLAGRVLEEEEDPFARTWLTSYDTLLR